MKVFDYNLYSEDQPNVDNYIAGVGFLLKRFKDESEFNHYINEIQQNDTTCVFKKYLDQGDDLFKDGDDTFSNDGDGQVLDAVEDGIFLDMSKTSRWAPSTAHVSYNFRRGEAGYYFLIYQICSPPKDVTIYSDFELDFHFSNQDSFSNESYLSAGEMILPHLFFSFFLLYSICLYVWTSNIRAISEGRVGYFADPVGGRPLVYPIHHIMSFLLLLKTFSILFESIRYHYLRVTGHASVWSALYYTFAFLKGTILFTAILLIGSGWSFVKPFLSDREKKMIFAILVLQVINNIAIVVLTQETEGEVAFDRWTAVLHLVDIICCCAVLIPIVWQVNTLEKNIELSNNSLGDIGETSDAIISEDEFENEPLKGRPNDQKLASKLKLFRSFYLLVVAYIYTTRIVVYIFASTLDYRHQWVKHFVIEGVTLAFYFTVGSLFKPMSENPYLSRQGAVEVELTL